MGGDVALMDGPELELAEAIEVSPAAPLDDRADPPGSRGRQAALWHAAGVAPSLQAQVEGILFVSDRPVDLGELMRSLDATRAMVEQALDGLATDCAERGLRVQRNNGLVQLVSAPEVAPAIQRFLGLEDSTRLSRAALESLSIIAYRQPITRPEIDALRGVNSDGVMRTLLSRGMVEPVGQRETVGHPIEYGTTFRFLEYFGIGSLDELPPLELASPDAAAVDPPEGLLDDRPGGDAEVDARAIAANDASLPEDG